MPAASAALKLPFGRNARLRREFGPIRRVGMVGRTQVGLAVILTETTVRARTKRQAETLAATKYAILAPGLEWEAVAL